MAGKSETLSVTTTPAAILVNGFASGKIAKVITLVATNTSEGDISLDVEIKRGGESYKLLKAGVVPGRKSLSVFLSKDFGIFLEQGDELRLFASGGGMEAVCSYELVDSGSGGSSGGSSSGSAGSSSSGSAGSSSSGSIPPPPTGSSSTTSFPASYTVSGFNAQNITANPDYENLGACSGDWTNQRLWMYEINGLYTFKFLDVNGSPVYGKEGSGCWEGGSYTSKPPSQCGGVLDGPWWLSRSSMDGSGNTVWAISSGAEGPGEIAYRMASIYKVEGGIQNPFADVNDDYTKFPTSRNGLCCANNPSCLPLSEGQIVLSAGGCGGFGDGYHPWEIDSNAYACSQPCSGLPNNGNPLTDIGPCWGSVTSGG